MSYYQAPVARLADELFLIAHDEFTGKPLSAANLLDTALAGAVLAELIVDGRVTIDRGTVIAVDPRPWQEPLTDLVLEQILHRGNGHATRLWLEYMRTEVQICNRVGSRLASAGWVNRVESRGLSLRASVRWPGTDANRAASPRVRLSAILGRSTQPLDLYTATLAALVRAGGLTKVVTIFDAPVVNRIDAARQLLPLPLESLLAAVDAAVAAAALSVRR
jgi:hypothetical protein